MKDSTILITGGTGSFGRKFTELVLKGHDPKRIIIFSRDELKQHDMQASIRDERVSYFIGDVRDGPRVRRAFEARVDLVVHAAAMKQVPACEYNPFEAVKTNILGAQNVIDAAIDCGVRRVIAISTDKAVSPVNLYGATKLCAEKLFIQGNSYAGARLTRFSCVRYGNVLGSRGSVVPVFMRQRATGTVTVTDPRMTRFWITLEQAVKFVIRCAGVMRGGEVFVPRIPSLSINDLVRAIAPGCKVKVSGIRPGEKVNEVLISVDEARHTIRLPDMFVVTPEHQWWSGEPWPDGESLPDGFSYSSDGNEDWLTVESLRKLLGVSEDGPAVPALQRAAA